MMKLLVLCLISCCLAGKLPEGVDDLDDVSLEEFEEHFGQEQVTDPEEKEAREEALREHEEMVKEANEAFALGEQTWYDEINEYSDLPDTEFEANHTGLLMNITDTANQTFFSGWLDIPLPYDEESERLFDSYRLSRAAVPASYSAVTAGLVTPVKSQGNCGSCAAFATMALVETCFAKNIGGASKTGDYSEQHFVDCGYGYNGMINGCNGAAPHGYAAWLAAKKPDMASEAAYPYKQALGTCPSSYTKFFQGASITGGYWTQQGGEDLLKKLVAEHGAVMTGVAAAGPFSAYKGGIFAGCTSSSPDHAVVVVGYGTENGVDYWLVKNSWGSGWGEKGYIRVKRGVSMCGIGGTIVHVKCGKASGTTSATQATTTTTTTTTAAPSSCQDHYSNCADIAKQWCWSVGHGCCKSCGLGEGMTPAASYTCYDEYSNCGDEGMCDWAADQCKKSCKKC